MTKPMRHRCRTLAPAVCLGGALWGLLHLVAAPAAGLAKQGRPKQNADQPSQFDYPKAGTNVRRTKEGSFAAYGLLDKEYAQPGGLHCVLKTSEGKLVRKGRMLLDPTDESVDLHWSAAFFRVPAPDKPSATYKIELRTETQLVATLEGLTLKGSYGTQISWPVQGDTVSASFTAYGSSDTSVSTGQMVSSANQSYAPTLVQQYGKSWYITFQNVPTPPVSGWTLKVFDTNSPLGGTPADQQSGISVR